MKIVMEDVMEEERRKLAEFLHRVDAVCARMNGGVSAFAILLAVAVTTMAAVRGSELTSDWPSRFGASLDTEAPSGTRLFNGWTYN